MINKHIAIDPGHGGKDIGASYGYINESNLNLSIAFLLECELLLQGFDNVTLIRGNDTYIPLKNRTSLAGNIGAGTFISIHCDAFTSKSANGMTVHVSPHPTQFDLSLANHIKRALKTYFPKHKSREIKKSDFYVLRETPCMQAVLIECEFMSNPEQLEFLKQPATHRKLARAISFGTQGFFSDK